MKKAIVLDDYQGVARRFADWGVLDGRVEVDILTRGIASEAELVERLREYEIVVLMRERTPFPATLLAQLPALELLLTTGPFNAVIDLEAAAARGVPVWATRGFLPSTTELAWALILACVKNVCGNDREVRSGGWQTAIGGDLHGSRLGVIGLGYYGGEVARIGHAFGMDVVAWSENLTPARGAELGVATVSRQELLETSDVVSIHLKLSDRTRGLLTEPDLRSMKPTAYLVNTSRGPIVDEPALIRALQEGWIAGAGLDVFDAEPLPAEHPLRTLDNVVTSPHVGYVTERSYRIFFEDVVENIACHLEARPGRAMGTPYRSGPFYVPG